MPIVAQALRLCSAALAISLTLVVARGLPMAESPAPQAMACAAPSDDEQSKPGAVRWISQQEAHALASTGTVTFVDCRSLDEFEAGHVSGSVHVPPERDPLRADVLALVSRGSTVVTYCDAEHQCARSQRIASQLAAAGLSDVRVLEGGMPAWLQNGYPAESGSCPLCPSP